MTWALIGDLHYRYRPFTLLELQEEYKKDDKASKFREEWGLKTEKTIDELTLRLAWICLNFRKPDARIRFDVNAKDPTYEKTFTQLKESAETKFQAQSLVNKTMTGLEKKEQDLKKKANDLDKRAQDLDKFMTTLRETATKLQQDTEAFSKLSNV